MVTFKTFVRLTAVCLALGAVSGTLHAQDKSATPTVEVDQNTSKLIEASKAKTQAEAPKDAGAPQTAPAEVSADPSATKDAGAPDANAAKDSKDPKDPKAAKDAKDKAKKEKKKKEKAPKTTPVSIVNGTLTIDGATGKALLNYDIADLRFIYIYVPGLGTAVVSNKPFAGGVEQKDAFGKNALDVMVDDHKLEIYSDKPLFDTKVNDVKRDKDLMKQVEHQQVSAWVAVDKDFTLPTHYPAMGYGTAAAAPYMWPASKPSPKREKGVVAPPPMPSSLRPVQVGQKNPFPDGSSSATAGAATASKAGAPVADSQKSSTPPAGATQ